MSGGSGQNNLIHSGVTYLRSILDDRGFWQDFDMLPWPGRSDAWATAYTLRHLIGRPRLNRIASRILNLSDIAAQLHGMERRSGGWSYNSETRADIDSTSNAILALLPFNRIPSRATVAFFRARRLSDGSFSTFETRWPTDSWGGAHVDVAGLALAAAKGANLLNRDERRLSEMRLVEDIRQDSFWWGSRNYFLRESIEYLESVGRLGAIRSHIKQEDFVETTAFDIANKLVAFVKMKEKWNVSDIHIKKLAWKLAARIDNDHWKSSGIILAPRPSDDVPHNLKHVDVETKLDDINGVFSTVSAVYALSIYEEATQ